MFRRGGAYGCDFADALEAYGVEARIRLVDEFDLEIPNVGVHRNVIFGDVGIQEATKARIDHSEECRHFRGLAVKGPVSGEEYRTFRSEGRESRSASPLNEFSISEIWEWERPETGCVSA